MERIGDKTYLCTVCHATVKVDSEERPVAAIIGQSGEPNVRVVTVEGVEVHRCVLADSPRSVRLKRIWR